MPLINNNASATEIIKWKKTREVAECYRKVFDQENKKSSMLLQLFEKVFAGEENPPIIHMAFVMAMYTVILDPDSQYIQVNESTMKLKIDNYMVSIRCLVVGPFFALMKDVRHLLINLFNLFKLENLK